MIKNLATIGLLALCATALPLTSCYNDDDLWENIDNLNERIDGIEAKINAMNTDMASMKTILEALQNKVSITSVEETADGYTIKFSDGQTATISNGKNGADGQTPQISVEKGADGLYYWTVNGQRLQADGKDVCASAVAPQIRINDSTKQWEISTDGGQTWTSTGVSAEGQVGPQGDSFFKSVDTSNANYVVFTLADGTQIKLARYDENLPKFQIQGCAGVQDFSYGETISYAVDATNVADYAISKPDGWTAKYAEGKISITAPVAANTYAEKAGTVAITLVSKQNKSMIAKIAVQLANKEIRTLTFEDADAKFTAYTLDYASANITNWSDLIGSPQYGSTLLYGTSGYGMDEPYYWYDEGNTELFHQMVNAYDSYCMWNGAECISNYASTDCQAKGDFTSQLTVYGTSGHNGSKNFCIHNGYRDNSGYRNDMLSAIEFADGVARVVDHMYVNITTYLYNSLVNGSGLSTAIGESDWVKIYAYGFDENNNKVGTAEMYLCNGPDNIVTDWTKWDLSVLGKVARIEFNIGGSSDNGYGFSQPAYFAWDDAAVVFSTPI